ncbi:MAG: AraC family ligand binding domain-containing protein [Piscinibacter sp.]
MRRPDPAREIDIDLARRTFLEQASGETVALASDYPGGWRIKRHNHTRGQLMNALDGVVVVVTDAGRWIVPPQYGLWIPAGVFHEVEILGDVKMRSVYVTPGAIEGLPEVTRVVAITDLMRALIIEAVTLPNDPEPTSRAGLVMALMLREIPRLPEQPLGLAMPSDPRLAALCRRIHRGALTRRPHRRLGRRARDEPARLYPRLPPRDRPQPHRMAPAGLALRGSPPPCPRRGGDTRRHRPRLRERRGLHHHVPPDARRAAEALPSGGVTLPLLRASPRRPNPFLTFACQGRFPE